MEVIRKPEDGINFVDYEVNGNKITFGDDELTVNLAKKERDDNVTLDLCRDFFGGLVLGTGGARTYVAQIFIPARQYEETETEQEGETSLVMTPVPFSMDNVTLTLYEEEV